MDNLNNRISEYYDGRGRVGARRELNGVVRWVGMVIVLAAVLAFAVKVAFALTYVGPVTVTANMGSFSPNPVEVNNAVTSSLSANYSPPSGLPEGDLSAQYNWSVSQVQYKALQADTYGSPPADSYTDSISPTQPAASSGATLTFTPLIAGYWAVSVSCGVTVTDTQTSQYWSGSGNAGPQDLTSVEVTFSPKNGSAVFLNTNFYVHVTYAPSDLTANLGISGGMTFAGGATSQAMTSDSEEVYFYGPNVYSSGGPSSGDITLTVSPPGSGSAPANGPQAASSTGGFGGATLQLKSTINSLTLSGMYKAGSQIVVSALESTIPAIMQNVETNDNNYLQGVIAGGGPQSAAAALDSTWLNTQGYPALQGTLSTFISDMATGSSNAFTSQGYLLDLAPGTAITFPGLPASALKPFSLTPSMAVTLNYNFLNSKDQGQNLKLGDLLTNFGITGTGPISTNTPVPIQGTWTGSIMASLSAGHNFTLQDGTYSASIGLHVDLYNGTSVQFVMQANVTYAPQSGNVQNDLIGQVNMGIQVTTP